METTADSIEQARIEEILKWMQYCGRYDDFRAHLRANDLPSGRGWAQIRSALLKCVPGDVLGVLEPYVDDVVRHGSKCIYLLNVPAAGRKRLRQYCAQEAVLPDTWELDGELFSADPILAGCVSDAGEGTASMIFGSARRLNRRVPVDRDWIKPDHLDEIGAGADIYALSSATIAAYDVLHIPADDAEPCRLYVSNEFNNFRMGERPDAIAERVLATVEEVVGVEAATVGFDDLFDLVDQIYRDPSEGRVAELQFRCGTGARRTEVIKRKDDGDLRSESYHVAGKLETTVEPFALTVAWDGHDRELELSVRGTSRMLNLIPGSRLRRAETNARTRAEYEYVVQKLITIAVGNAPVDAENG